MIYPLFVVFHPVRECFTQIGFKDMKMCHPQAGWLLLHGSLIVQTFCQDVCTVDRLQFICGHLHIRALLHPDLVVHMILKVSVIYR